MAKLFNNITWFAVNQTTFNEDIIFPFYKRTTSAGITNFCAGFVSIFSFLVAELDRPLPAIFLMVTNFIAFVASFLVPSQDEEREFERRYKTKPRKME